MKLFKVVAGFLVAAVMALTLSACAPTATKEGTGGYIDDTVITTKVKAQLLNDEALKLIFCCSPAALNFTSVSMSMYHNDALSIQSRLI